MACKYITFKQLANFLLCFWYYTHLNNASNISELRINRHWVYFKANCPWLQKKKGSYYLIYIDFFIKIESWLTILHFRV